MEPPRARPQLARHARIVPFEAGWLVPAEVRTEPIQPAVALPDPDGFLDLLDGSNDAGAIAVKAGMPRFAVESLLARFAALGLLHAEEAPERGHAAGPQPLPRPRGAWQPPPILVAGLGVLGTAVLRELAELEGAVLQLFDPARVEPADVHPFYGPEDVGGDRATVASERLAGETRARLDPLVADDPTRTGVEHALRAAVSRVGLVVCCSDRPSHLCELLCEVCGALGVPLVMAVLAEDHGCVTPPDREDDTDPWRGCARCWLHHRDGGDAFASALARHVRERFPRPARWRPATPRGAVEALAHLTVLVSLRSLDVSRGLDHPDARMLRIDWEGGHAVGLRIPRHPDCRRCHPVVPRRLSELRRRAVERWRDGSRRESPPTALAALRSRLDPLVSCRDGLFRGPSRVTAEERERVARVFLERGVDPRASRLAHAHVSSVARLVPHMQPSVSQGMDLHDPRSAEALAIMEALERLSALELCDPELVVRARHADVAADALDPRELPLFAEEQYRDPAFPLEPFRPDREIDWLWGIRVATEEPLLVPRELIFGSRTSKLYRPSSNGAACHTSLLHAVRNGILETVERDALMVAWLGRLSLPRLELSRDPDPLRRELEALSFDLRHVDLTTDLGIPVTLGILRDRRNPDFVMLDVVAAPDARSRLAKLHRELVQFSWPYLLDRDAFRTAATGSWEPDSVQGLPDHAGFYQDRAKHRLLAFLDGAATTRRAPEPAVEPPASPVREELRRLVGRLADRGYEVIAVDCTHRFLRSLGLHAVKVLIPGLQPLNAGHRFRTLGGSRVLELPRALGLCDRPLRIADLNPWPHPFW